MDTGVASLTPSSGTSSSRSTPVPVSYKQIMRSPSLLALTKAPDEELRRRNPDELLYIIRQLEAENYNMVAEHSAIIKDVNKRTQIYLFEIKGLKEVNQSLQDDNQELRDLCCFLDDDRQRGRKLAKEWQRFGRYTASVMRSEVSTYQEKLKDLELKQQELIADNLNLKELCLYLDQERQRISQTRDDGDGSSTSTVAGNEEPQIDMGDIELLPISQLQYNGNTNEDSGHSAVPSTSDYIRQLEDRIKQLETYRQTTVTQVEEIPLDNCPKEPPKAQVTGTRRLCPDGNRARDDSLGKVSSPHKPEAVVHAMKVLEVHENLERPQTAVGEENDALDDKEKAIVREMCNVVWRKLGNVKAEQDQSRNLQAPVYENLKAVSSKSTPTEYTGKQPQLGDKDIYKANHQYPISESDDLIDGPGSSDRNQGTMGIQVMPHFVKIDSVVRNEYQGKHTGLQRMPPVLNDKFQGQTQAPPANQQTKYGFAQTSRSTPVTQQQNPMPNATNRVETRSHSPIRSLASQQQGQSTVQQQRSQSSDANSWAVQNTPLYQNQPPLNNSTDHPYENIAHGPYYGNASQNVSSGHNRSNCLTTTGSSPIQSPKVMSNNYKAPSGLGNKQSWPHNQQPQFSQNQNIATSSQESQRYQKIPSRSSNQTKTLVDDTSSQGTRPIHSQNNPSVAVAQTSSHKNIPITYTSSGNPQSYQLVSQSRPPQHSGYNAQPPGYNAPPQYDRRASYVEARENQQQYGYRPDKRNMDLYNK